MDSSHFEHPSNREYPAIELDMTYFMEHLSDEHICGKLEVKDDIRTNPNIIDCKTEDYTDLEEILSISRNKLEQEEKVRKFDMEFLVFYQKRFW